jgi:hypothetical protein
MDRFSDTMRIVSNYRMHILVFLIASLLAITFVHPQLLITDEWVTVNQVSQLHNGDQIIFSEGKYGSYQNGTPYEYFKAKQNYLAYPLFLPILSMPSYGLLDLFGNYFIFFVLYLWTFILLAIAITLNTLFPEYTRIGKWRWTTGLIIGTFVLFFLNLFLYRPFTIAGYNAFTEIAAVAFTHIILFSFLGLIIYETCRLIFENQEYALFGTLTCISCSSYLFWTSFCKDHLLVAFLVAIIILLLVKLWSSEDVLYLASAFLATGLLAWARPEVAFGIAVMLCILVLYILIFMKSTISKAKERYLVLISPAFMFIGAMPFFINNYLFTHNIFIPSFVVWSNSTTPSTAVIGGATIAHQSTPGSTGTLLVFLQSIIVIDPATFFSDLYGVLFNPASCSVGVFLLIPVFLVAVLLVPILIIYKQIIFTSKDLQLIGILLLMALGISLVYLGRISTMNNDWGITPDIRYLSPVYLPLTIIGLLILRKIPELTDRPLDLIKGMFGTWIILIPILSAFIGRSMESTNTWYDIFPVLNAYFSLAIYGVIVLFLITAIYSIIFSKTAIPAKIFLILICAVPLVWQILLTFVVRNFATGLGGYSFWIPAVLNWYAFIFFH